MLDGEKPDIDASTIVNGGGNPENTNHESQLIIPATFGLTSKQPRGLLKGDP